MSDANAQIPDTAHGCKSDVPAEYDALVCFGFSHFKSLEIMLDAKRGDSYAKKWVKLAIEKQHK